VFFAIGRGPERSLICIGSRRPAQIARKLAAATALRHIRMHNPGEYRADALRPGHWAAARHPLANSAGNWRTLRSSRDQLREAKALAFAALSLPIRTRPVRS
jgi:hypothetical protein